jgi:hypothetical protein
MPRAADGVADDQAFGERSVIMSAVRGDGEELVTASDEQHLILTGPASEAAAIRDPAEGDAGTEVRWWGIGCGRVR